MVNNSFNFTSLPSVNIRENNDNSVVEMAAPGMTNEDFKIELDGNLLTIGCEKENKNEMKEGKKYTRREFSY